MKNSAKPTAAPAPVPSVKTLDEEIMTWIQLKVAKAQKRIPLIEQERPAFVKLS
ncbi:MAG: hypothetical protein WAQ28_06590 [Bacteroidia bacterium]|jgi:hypothetical protein